MDYSKEDNLKKKKNHNSKSKKVSNRFVVILSRVLIAVVLIGGFALAGAFVGAYYGIIESADTLNTVTLMTDIKPKNFTTILYDTNGEETERLSDVENRIYIESREIPKNLKNAFVAIEDERFYQHSGIDLKGMARALYTNIMEDSSQGASTITQQLIKNNVTGVARNTIDTKLQEQYLAIQLEKLLSSKDLLGSKAAAKDYILEVYLNTIGLNHGLNGVQAASKYYFNKDASELTLSECTVIAAITQNPTKYTPKNHPENNLIRRNATLDKMLELNMITRHEYQEAIADSKTVYERIALTEEKSSRFSYFTDQVIKEVTRDLHEKYGYSEKIAQNLIYNGGLKIYTTQDMEMQSIMDKEFLNEENFPKNDFEIFVEYDVRVKNTITEKISDLYRTGTVKSHDEIEPLVDKLRSELVGANDDILDERYIPTLQPQAAMIIMDHKANIKAVTGGRGEKMVNRSLNRATDSKRQPGSVFKILASFAPAIDLGKATPGTLITDEPYTVPGTDYSPKNWYKGYKGPSTIRQGVKWSMNILAVRNMVETGVDACFDYLLNFGLDLVDGEVINGQVKSDRVPAAALGGITYGVTQLEVTAAFASIANKGEFNKPIFYTKVEDHDGNILLKNESEPRQVLKETSAFLVTDMMKDVVSGGAGVTGAKAGFKTIKMPVAGKTGTTNDSKDLTFVGYTPYYVAGIWLGYDQPKVMREDRGYHLTLWQKIMEEIHIEKSLENKPFEMPLGIATASVCSDSGMIGTDACRNDPRGNRVVTDYFVTGTLPKEPCDSHKSVTLCKDSNLIATEFCPEDTVVNAIRVIRNFGYTAEDSNSYYQLIKDANGELPKCDMHDTTNSFPNINEEFEYWDPIDGTLRTFPPTLSPSSTERPAIIDYPTFGPQITPSPQPTFDPQITLSPQPTFDPPLPTLAPTSAPTTMPTLDPQPSDLMPILPPPINEGPIISKESLDDFDY